MPYQYDWSDDDIELEAYWVLALSAQEARRLVAQNVRGNPDRSDTRRFARGTRTMDAEAQKRTLVPKQLARQ